MQDGLDPCLADALLLLATDEGQNLNAYARMAGVSNGVMASYFVELSDRARHREPLGLVAWMPHPLELRTSQMFLTPQGMLAAKRLQAKRGGRRNAAALGALKAPPKKKRHRVRPGPTEGF